MHKENRWSIRSKLSFGAAGLCSSQKGTQHSVLHRNHAVSLVSWKSTSDLRGKKMQNRTGADCCASGNQPTSR